MKELLKMKGVFKSRFSFIYDKLKIIYRYYERILIMYLPFLTSIFYIISIYLYKTGESAGMFNRYNANLYGHSIFWIQVVLSRSKNMCKWYKGALLVLIFTHIINLMYYHGYMEKATFMAISLCASILSIILWLIFRVTYKTSKIIQRECKREEERRRY